MCKKIKDSGTRATFETGAVRDGEKYRGRFDLLPGKILGKFTDCGSDCFRALAVHYERGSEKYGERNWQKGIPVHVYFNSAFRHHLAVLDGRDDEPHNAAFAWNMICMLWTIDAIVDGELPQSLWNFPFEITPLDYDTEDCFGCCIDHLLDFLHDGDTRHLTYVTETCLEPKGLCDELTGIE